MRIPSGVTDQYVYFVAVDATDFATRETGLSSFTVYRSRNGGAAAAMTTPTINETDATNMPGVYELLVDEDTTIDAGDDSQEMVFHITHAGMAPVTRTIELYRRTVTAGYTLGVGSDGDLLEVNTLTGHTAQTGDSYARLGAPAGASVSADTAAIKADTAAVLTDTGTTLPATLTTIEGKVDTVDTVVDGIQTDLSNGTDGLGAIKADTAAILVDTADMQPKLGTPAADVSADIAAIKAETASILTDTGTTLDGKLNDIQGATFDTATDSLEAIRNRGDSAWTTGAGGTPPQLLQSTTIATLASQTSFTLTSGSADDDAYNGAVVVVTDSATSTQKAVGSVSDYTGSTKTVTLSADPAIFTMAVGDTIEIIAALGSGGGGGDATAANQTTIINHLTDVKGATWDSTNSLEAIHDDLATVDTVVDGIKAVTDLLPDAGALSSLATAAALATVDTVVDAILLDTGTTIPGTIATLQADTDDIQTRLPAALVSGKMDSDTTAISGSTTAADNLEASALGIVSGACEGSPSTTVIQTDLAEATDDHYIGRVVVFTSGAAAGEATDITDYTGATGTLTVTAITTAPSASDTFVIV